MQINKIDVAGTGYVGLSLATLLAQHNHVVAVDVIKEKVDLINSKSRQFKTKKLKSTLLQKNLI